MDVASVTAVSAATAPSAAAPVSIDAMFGTMLQSVTDAEPSALPTPLVQSAALAMVLPGNPTGQQDTVTPSLGTPWLFASVNSTVPATPVPGTSQSAPVNNAQQSASAAAQQSAAWLAGAATPVQTGATTENSGSSTPVVPTPASTVQPPLPQQATPVAPASGQQTSAQQPSTQNLAPLPAAPEPAQIPVQTPSQTASSQTTSSPAQPAEQVPTPPNGALEVADQLVAPAPRDPVTAKAPKSKVAAEPQAQDPKSDDTTNTNTIVNVLAGFLLPQIEPTAVPANDATADTVDPAASTKSNDQGKPVVATADQNSAATAQPSPAAVVQPPMVQPPAAPVAAPIQTDGQNATAAAGLPKTATPAAAAQATGQDNAPTVAQKPATRQQAKTAAAGTEKQPVFVPANDTAPDRKPEIQPTADARTPATADSPQPVQASASTPAPHQAPAASQIANPAIIPVAPSGLRKLTAGLQVTAQEQDTRSSIDKLGLTIATKSIDGLRHFDIRLDPPELGRVQVQLTTDDAGRSQANVVVDKPHTLELLQRDAQSLNRALNDAGLDVSNNGLNFSLREQSRQNDGGADQGRGRSLSVQAVMQTDATHIHSSLGSYAPNSVRLDIRV